MPLFGPPNVEKLKAKSDIKKLIKSLDVDDLNVRDAASKALVQIGGSRVVEGLVAALTDDKKRVTAAQALVKIGADAVEPLIASLENHQPEVCRCAAEILGEIGDCRAVEPLIARLNSGEGLQAAVALAKFGDVRAVKPLIDVLDAPRRYPAYAEQKRTRLAFETLVKMGKTAVGPLIAELRRSIGSDLSPAVLVEIGEPAVEPLIAALKVRSDRLLVETLAKIGDRRACGPIIDYIFQSMVLHSEKSLRKLFGSYYQLIDGLISGVTVKEVTVEEIDQDWYEDRYARGPSGGRTTYTTKEYSFTNSFQALEKLISMDTSVSSNLLHKVKNIPSGSIVECREGFEQMRRKAAEELIRRGNPPYDLSAYHRIV